MSNVKSLIIEAARKNIILSENHDGKLRILIKGRAAHHPALLDELKARKNEILAYLSGRAYTLDELIEITACRR